MPNLLQNLRYAIASFWFAHSKQCKHILSRAGILVAIALIFEVFVFNFNYFASSSLKTINLKDRIDLVEAPDGSFRLTSFNHQIEFFNLNTEVRNIRVDFVNDQPAQLLTLSIHFTDEAHKTYFDSTEYSVGIPDVEVATNSLQSEFININASGIIENLKIEVVGDDVSYPIRLNTIELNAHHPFDFNAYRFLAVLFIVFLAYMFRPSSSVYRFKIVENPKVSKSAVVATAIVECILCSIFLFYGSNLVGVATSSYNYGEWDGHSLVNTFEVGGDNAQQYAELAKSFTQGKLYLEEEPPGWLLELDEPYDKGIRDEAQKETGEEYLFDVAYYDGHYYVYFGVVPVLLFYLPFYLLFGQPFPTAVGVLIAAFAYIVGCTVLLDRFARYHFKKVSLGLFLLLQITLIVCSGMLYLLKFPTFYSLPIVCALGFSVWGLYFWLRGRISRHRYACFLIGSLCMALVFGCRPQFVILSLLAFPLFWRPYITEGRIRKKRGIREFICLIAPYAIVIGALLAYNYARFGSLLDFGANYNLTMNDMTKRGMNIGRIAPAFFAYFLQPPNVVGVFPFLQPVDFATTYVGQTIKEATFGGIFACLPILWVVFFSRPVVKIRNSQRPTGTISGVIAVLIASGIIIALLDAQMAGILQRYYADFSFMFLAAAVLIVFIANENISETSSASKHQGLLSRVRMRLADIRKGKRMARPMASGTFAFGLTRDLLMKTLLALSVISIAYSLLLCATPETGWYSDIYDWAYHDFLETVLFWT